MMRLTKVLAAVLGLLVTIGVTEEGNASWYMQEDSPNDSVSRGLNEMKAKARPLPPTVDPRDTRIAALEKQVSDLEADLGRLRGTAGNMSDANRRIGDLELQLSDRDRELVSLRAGAGDSARLASRLSSAEGDNSRLAAELAASQGSVAALQAGAGDKDKRVAELERLLADRDKELAGLRGELSAEMTKLKEAQRGLIRALGPEIDRGDITVDLNNERLLINLAASYAFPSGQDELNPAGADALKQVGGILRDFPEYKVAVDGHTDNVPIHGALMQRFPTNKELSEARAANAAKTLADGGLSNVLTAGYADTNPVASNATPAGRAKNRRVEVRVTK